MAAFRLALYAGVLALAGAAVFLAAATAHGQTPGTPACGPRIRLDFDLGGRDRVMPQRRIRLEIDEGPGYPEPRAPYAVPWPAPDYGPAPYPPPRRYDPRDCPVCPPAGPAPAPYRFDPRATAPAPGGYQEYAIRPRPAPWTPAVGPPPRVTESRSVAPWR